MTKKEWTIVGVLGVIAVGVFLCFGCLVLGTVVNPSPLRGIVQVLATPTPEHGSITGVVSWQTKGSGNIVVVGITINAWSADGTRLIANATTDASGNYKVLSIPPGKYIVSANQKASSVGTQIAEKCWVVENVEVRPGQTTQLSLSYDNASETDTRLTLILCK